LKNKIYTKLQSTLKAQRNDDALTDNRIITDVGNTLKGQGKEDNGQRSHNAMTRKHAERSLKHQRIEFE